MMKIGFLCCMLFAQVALACGGGWYPNYEYHYLFNQELISDTALFPMLYDAENPYYIDGHYYEQYRSVNFPEKDPNLVAWQKYLGENIPLQHIGQVLYGISESDLAQLYRQIELGLLGNQKSKYQQNSVIQGWAAGRFLGFYRYLLYAKQCANYAVHSDNLWRSEGRNEMLMRNLLKVGLKKQAEEEIPFLQDRYAFQLVRLAHYLAEHERAVHLFDSLYAHQPESYIYYRAMEQAGGALRALGQPKAAYYFSRVFDELPDRNKVALSSFRVTNQEEWDEALSYCKSTQEEVVFNVMRAFQQGGLDVEEMETVYSKLPASPYMELLLVRQVNQYERFFRTRPGGNEHYFYSDQQKTQFYAYLKRLHALVQKAVGEKKVSNLPLFKLALGQVMAWNGEAAAALAYLEQEEFSGKYKNQAQVLIFDLRLQLVNELTPAVADAFEREYQEEAYLQAVADVRPRMINLYGQHFLAQKDTARAFLCYNSLSALEAHLHLGVLKKLQAYYDQEPQSALDQYLKHEKKKGEAVKYLNFLRGKYYFLRNDLALAEKWWAKNDEAYYVKSNADAGEYDRYGAIFGRSIYNSNPAYSVKHKPFLPQTDSLHREFTWLNVENSFLSFVRELQEIEARARANPPEAGKLYLMLANAWVNLSPEGWYRMVLSEQGSYYGAVQYIPQPKNFIDYGRPSYYYYNPQIVLHYVELGLAASEDPEVRAKLNFAGAYAEMIEYLTEESYPKRYGAENPFGNFIKNSRYFEEMIKKYQETAFYREAIQECGYFEQRVNMEGG